MTAASYSVDREIGGVSARELAETYGTPLFVVDLDVLDLEIDGLLRAFASRGIAVGYAGKAFLCAAFAEHLAGTPLRLDVCSLGELVTAERGGFPATRTYFHGCGKTDEELRAIVEHRVAFDVVDNREELERLAAIARRDDPVDMMLRLNTGIEAHTHAFVRTGGENTKFGVPLDELGDVLLRVAALPQLRLIGLHSHLGSQIADVAPFMANLDELIAAAQTARKLELPSPSCSAAGGSPSRKARKTCVPSTSLRWPTAWHRARPRAACASESSRAGRWWRAPARRSTASWRSRRRAGGASSSSTAGWPTTPGRCSTARGTSRK